MRSLSCLVLAALCVPCSPQKPRPQKPTKAQTEAEAAALADLTAFESWLQAYRSGGFRMMKDGETDLDAVAQVEKVMANLARFQDLVAVR